MSGITPAVGLPSRGRSRGRLRQLLSEDKLLTASGLVCLLLLLMAAFGPLLAPYSPSSTDILNSGQGPGAAGHLLGTDSLGRDILTRILYGARISLLAPAVVMILAVIAGTTLALSSVWIGGWFDRVIARVVNVMFAFPALLIALVTVAIFEPGIVAPVLALAVAYTPYLARIIRSVALRERHLPYVEAYELFGYSGWRITTRHILPNLRPLILAQATIGYGIALVDLAAISFLGLGVQPPTAEWGVMVAEGRTELLNGQPQQTIAAGVMIIIAVVAVNVFGERLGARIGADRG